MQLIGRILRIAMLSLLVVSGGLSGAAFASAAHHLDACTDSELHSHSAEGAASHAHTAVAETAHDSAKASDDCATHGCPTFFELTALQGHSQPLGRATLIATAHQLRLLDHPESLHRPPNT